jgi:ABC-type Fe3+-hydroxamate transport system substrate-binding protein
MSLRAAGVDGDRNKGANMFSSKAVSVAIVGGLALAGCHREPDTTKTTTQTETTQVGSTSATTSETKIDGPSGDTKSNTNSYVGTVTVFDPGKRIEVMTGNKETHTFALDGKNDIVVVDRAIEVGSKVRLVEEKGEKGFHKISVSIAPAA